MLRYFWTLVVAVVLLAVSVVAFAENPVYNNGTLRIELTQEDCESPTAWLGLMMNSGSEDIKKAKVTSAGEDLQACWVSFEDKVLVADETGRGGYVEKKEFARKTGI